MPAADELEDFTVELDANNRPCWRWNRLVYFHHFHSTHEKFKDVIVRNDFDGSLLPEGTEIHFQDDLIEFRAGNPFGPLINRYFIQLKDAELIPEYEVL